MRKLQHAVFFLMGSIFLTGSLHAAPEAIIITPTTFDFGWCPDNAKISAEFSVKNAGVDIIPIASVQPTCGCTASQFTPGPLASNAETKVGLTFNTRGYNGSAFNKVTKVKTESGNEYNVNLTGNVNDPAAKIFPDQGGVASFEPGSKEKKKTIKIQNKTDKDVDLTVIHNAADWAKANLSAQQIKAGESVGLEVSVDGSYDAAKDTSVTLEARSGDASWRLTVAIRTGPAPSAVRSGNLQAPAKPAPEKPAVKPLKTEKPETK